MVQFFVNKLTSFAVFDLGECDPSQNNSSFFGLPHWWQYIPTGNKDGLGHCVPNVRFPDDIWSIAFAVIDMMLRLAGLVAIIMIIIAGVSYMTAAGSVEKAAAARQRIFNAVIGLAIVLIAASLVAFIGNKLGG